MDLRFLVDQCHQHGLAVIFDVVYNHVVADDQFDRLIEFDGNTVNNQRGIYFSTMDNFGPVPDFDRPEVMSFFTDNIRQCFREFDGDALASTRPMPSTGHCMASIRWRISSGRPKRNFPANL